MPAQTITFHNHHTEELDLAVFAMTHNKSCQISPMQTSWQSGRHVLVPCPTSITSWWTLVLLTIDDPHVQNARIWQFGFPVIVLKANGEQNKKLPKLSQSIPFALPVPVHVKCITSRKASESIQLDEHFLEFYKKKWLRVLCQLLSQVARKLPQSFSWRFFLLFSLHNSLCGRLPFVSAKYLQAGR